MCKWILIIFLIAASINFIKAQQVEVQSDGSVSGNAYLYELSGEKTILIDSASAFANGVIKFSLGSSIYHPGFYRLVYDNKKTIDFVNDGEDISFSMNSKNVSEDLQIIESGSNKLYYNFIKLNKAYKAKADLLQLIIARFPKDDDYYLTTLNKLASIQKEYTEFVKSASINKPNSFITRYIRSAQMTVLPSNITMDKQLGYLKSHALEKVDFKDYQLIYSDVFVNKAIEYLTLYRNPQLSKDQLENEFRAAVDSILNQAKVNQIVYQHLVEYLIDGFKKFGFDKILDYIVDNYVIKDDLCLDVKTEGLIKRRIDQAKILKIGAIAPNIILPDSSGKSIDLYKISSPKVLIVFYASWCPHCKELMPKLKGLKEIAVVAISLDTSKIDWLNFVKNNSLNFINVSDQKGWDGHSAGDYYIYATPTMFLLDSNKKIIGKPMDYEELHFIN